MKKDTAFFDVAVGYGKEEKPTPKAIPYLVCPLCGLNRPAIKTGSWSIMKAKKKHGSRTVSFKKWMKEFTEGERIKSRARIYNVSKKTRFDAVNIKREPFVIYKVPTGKGEVITDGGAKRGFVEVPELNVRLEDIKNLPEDEREIFLEYVRQVKDKCKEILDYIDELGL